MPTDAPHMDPGTVTIIVGAVTTTLGALGTGIYKVLCWIGSRIDKMLDSHESFLKSIKDDNDKKREILEALKNESKTKADCLEEIREELDDVRDDTRAIKSIVAPDRPSGVFQGLPQQKG